jgi:hypothetical protein
MRGAVLAPAAAAAAAIGAESLMLPALRALARAPPLPLPLLLPLLLVMLTLCRAAVADDHGFHDCSFTGSRVQTPTIDRFRASGIALEQHYVQKVCSPTRTAIMTGRYPHRNGMQTPFCGGSPEGLNLNETMMPEYMNSVGYTSQIVGKWVSVAPARFIGLAELTDCRASWLTAPRIHVLGTHAHFQRVLEVRAIELAGIDHVRVCDAKRFSEYGGFVVVVCQLLRLLWVRAGLLSARQSRLA